MAGLTSLGVGSGLDAETIVSKLMAVERIPLTRLNTRTSSYNAKISAYGSITSNLASLKTAASALYSTKTNLLTTSISDASVAKATAGASATAGTYSLEVTQLAKAHSISSRVVATTTETMGTGSLAISNGSNSFSVTVDGSNNTLSGIRDAINNNSSNTSVRASILTGTSGSRLVLTSKETGASNTISIAVTDNDGNNNDAYVAATLTSGDGEDTGPQPNTTPGLSQLAYTTGATNLTLVQAAQNASIKIDNVALSFSSNTVVDAIPGVTLNLTKETGTTPAIITVARDSSGLKKLADDFVKAYNDLRTTIVKNTSYDATTNTPSTLTGDSTVRSIDRQLREALRTVPAGVTGSITQLADVGIAIDSNGVMSVDSTKFQNAIDSNFTGLQSMLDGYGKATYSLITSLTDSNGVISARTSGLKNSIKLLDSQKELVNNRLDAIEKRYRARFTSLDTLISGMQSTSNFLTQQISRF